MTTNILTAAVVRKAIRVYESGARPYRFTEPRSWYVVGTGKRIYPLKYIYALAVHWPPASFNTSVARHEFERLNFEVRRQAKDEGLAFDAKVSLAMKDPRARAARLAKAQSKPRRMRILEIVVFDRNPDVVAEVLWRAKGKCGICKEKAPFVRRKNRTPYLEVHHKVQLAAGGDDTVANAIAVCPNCHRRAHCG